MQDIHRFIGVGSIIRGWYISTRFKELLEQFNIAKDYYFYPTKLLYKGEKLDYWIFQFPINTFQNYDYKKSEYYIEGDNNRILSIENQEEYLFFDNKLYKETKKDIIWKKIVFTAPFDMVLTMNNDRVVSERLKQAIETAGLEGFKFSEIDYEIGIG